MRITAFCNWPEAFAGIVRAVSLALPQLRRRQNLRVLTDARAEFTTADIFADFFTHRDMQVVFGTVGNGVNSVI